MSDDETCRFWCLVEGEELPFSVTAALKWEVDELTEAIQIRKHVLKNFDVSEIVLFSVRPSY
jgi:hypothetical protein